MKRKYWLAIAVFAAATLSIAGIGIATAASDGGGRSDLADAVVATAADHNIQVAIHDGYGRFTDVNGIACIAMDDMPQMGAMGIHYVNSKLVGDPSIDAGSPEALVYEPEQNGRLRLVALEYLVVQSAWDATHTSPPTLFGQQFNFTASPNRFGLPAFYSLHAWIWKHNPSGLFSMWNPNVSCASA
jgi:hypothetical protein